MAAVQLRPSASVSASVPNTHPHHTNEANTPSYRSVVTVAAAILLSGCQAGLTPTAGPSSPTSAPPSIIPTPSASPTPASTPSGTWIRLAPADGPPGAPIHIDGFLPGGPSAADADGNPTLQHTTVCWDGCLTGFTAVGVPVEWSADEAGRFTIDFTAPSVPWWSPLGPAPVQNGDYAVGIQCLGPLVPGCANQEAQATATFQLAGAEPKRCGPGQPCAELTLTPQHAQPGDTLTISGWAPIIETINGKPFGYTLAIDGAGLGSPSGPIGQVTQQLGGGLSGQLTVPQTVPGAGPLSAGSYNVLLQASTPQTVIVGQGGPTVATASLNLGPSVTWASLGSGPPVWLAPSADLVNPSVSIDPGNPQRLAYCASDAIRLSDDAGRSWRDVPVGGAVEADDHLGLQIMSGGAPRCISISLDATRPDSLYVVFPTADQQMGAPPEFFNGLTTSDGGDTWHIIPAPGQPSDFPFGGFAGFPEGRIEALFNVTGADAPATVAETTRDGGTTWDPAPMSCPGSGPCLRWGPAPGSIGGMGAPRPQALLRSTDAGQTWLATDVTLDLHASVAGAAAGFGGSSVLVVAGDEAFPARWSIDGGASWTVVALPALSGSAGSPNSFPALQILPDGSLIAFGPDGNWEGLPPYGQSWCSLSDVRLPQMPVRFSFTEDDVWWLDPVTGSPASAPLGATACSG